MPGRTSKAIPDGCPPPAARGTRKTATPSEHEFWFVGKIRRDNALQKLNKRQQKMLKRVQRWEKANGPLDQKKWDF